MDQVSLAGSTVIVTGASAGIGKETARELARHGARVILACRSQERGDAARNDIVNDTKNENVVVKLVDLSSLESIKRFADDICQGESRLNILVNNAAVFTSKREVTSDGFESDFGVNHLGHFYLTNLLLEKLKASAPSRIVTVSSEFHERHPLDFDDLQFERNWSDTKAYARSKTANVLFTVHLAKVLKGSGVTTYSLHPGIVRTELLNDVGQNTTFWKCFMPCVRCVQIPTGDGALTSLYCCLEPKLANETGLYYSDRRQKRAKRHATDPELAERLWNISKQMCGL